MALDWSNERYVRLYRETTDEAAWCWQARAIWPLILRKADRAGVIETTRGAKGIAAEIRIPVEVVEPGLAELVEDGCITATERGYAIPNYIEAQTATSSNTKRQAEWRARERAKEHADAEPTVTRRNARVTKRYAEETGRNGALRAVDSELSRAELIRDTERERVAPGEPALALSPPAKAPRRKREAKPETPCPDELAPNERQRSRAAELGVDADQQFRLFRSHHGANGRLFRDWSMAFDKWIENAPTYSRGGSIAQRPLTGLAATAEILADRAGRSFADPFKPRGNP